MVLSQIETMYSRGTKISVSVLDLNVIKITTTARHNFGQSILIRNNNPTPDCLREKHEHLERLGDTSDAIYCGTWKVTNSLYRILINLGISEKSHNMAFL